MRRDVMGELSDEARGVLERHCRTKSYPPNSVVYYQDDPTKQFYLVQSGYVRLSHILEDGSVTLYAIIPPSGTFGEAGVFEQFGYCDTSSTVTQTDLVIVSLEWIHEAGPAQDELRMALAKLIARRHRAHIEVTRALYLPNLAARLSQSLVCLLNDLGNEIKYKGENVLCLGPMVTQRDLGAMARGTRENVNKILKIWTKEGIIVVEDRHIIVPNIERLERLAFRV